MGMLEGTLVQGTVDEKGENSVEKKARKTY
jgi:hypothetical protein